MAKIATITSISTGHGSWPSRRTVGGSSNVFAEGLGVHRVGDSWVVHCNSSNECHTGATSTGSSNVYCNGRKVARMGDSISCGDRIATGRDTVRVGG